MTKEQFLKITRLDEYETWLSGKKKVGTQLKLNKIITNANSIRSNRLQTGDAVETESASPIRPLPSEIGKEQSPRFSGKSKEIVKLNKKFADFKTFRMNRSNWENQSKAVSGTGRIKSNETV
jgi:hypothetical protein